jgi:oxalate decarboxylase/phosphoglucose isomerase-like protein (cupin superfamily)
MNGKIKVLQPDINDKGIDHRGAIFSYVPAKAIVEFVYIDTKAGVSRGHHYHEEFDEYILMVHGEGVYVEYLPNGSTSKIIVGPGVCIHIPTYASHTFYPITDCKAISLLTKKWDDCTNPVTSVKPQNLQ